MPAPQIKMNLLRPLQQKKIVLKPNVKSKPAPAKSPFAGGMVNRIANTPAGCGCGGAR